ncbi:MAG: metallophosphoesterase [Xanthobacteraceae bacterium]|nr:metallophosphoesterase [Xanthobacteraceae bacterium]MCW5675359.1 metallophosphoesterase [Xanthobacteraceae bacterium]MCW5676598.1 metallophosphoesterase [Xanthobacteraceae bacterium]
MTIKDGGFDIVGDIHGHADALERLLARLGYTDSGDGYSHPSRQMIFVGDFIDRGPQQSEVLAIARNMCSKGSALAVLGNHEFNAMGWATSDGNGSYLRPHTPKNLTQHRAFLDQLNEGSAAYLSAIDWFRTLPVYLDLEGLRIVHACWHQPSLDLLRPHLDSRNRFTRDGFISANRKGSDIATAAEIVLKGPEIALPPPSSFFDKDGHERREARIKWWDHKATTFRLAAIGADPSTLPDTPIGSDYLYSASKPVLFGHYWLRGTPELTSPGAACLDFSVARAGYLTAYRWSGEAQLSAANLVSVPAAPD